MGLGFRAEAATLMAPEMVALIVYGVGLILGAPIVGWASRRWPAEDFLKQMSPVIVVAWPLVLALALVALPLWGLWTLGRGRRDGR